MSCAIGISLIKTTLSFLFWNDVSLLVVRLAMQPVIIKLIRNFICTGAAYNLKMIQNGNSFSVDSKSILLMTQISLWASRRRPICLMNTWKCSTS